MNVSILFEDTYLMVVNKPPGVVVNKAQSVKEETLQEWSEKKIGIEGQFQPHHKPVVSPSHESLIQPSSSGAHVISEEKPEYNIEDEFLSRGGIVHRIDKETSGILIIAKDPESFGALKNQFLERTVKKKYIALVHGQMPSRNGDINAPIGRLPWNREHFGVLPDGREAVTAFTVTAEYKKGKEFYSLVEAYPKTGRTHQIRVHLKYINHPIVADFLYAGRKTNRDDRRWAPRVMLHAAEIRFLHPKTQEELTVTADLPEDFSQVIALFQS